MMKFNMQLLVIVLIYEKKATFGHGINYEERVNNELEETKIKTTQRPANNPIDYVTQNSLKIDNTQHQYLKSSQNAITSAYIANPQFSDRKHKVYTVPSNHNRSYLPQFPANNQQQTQNKLKSYLSVYNRLAAPSSVHSGPSIGSHGSADSSSRKVRRMAAGIKKYSQLPSNFFSNEPRRNFGSVSSGRNIRSITTLSDNQRIKSDKHFDSVQSDERRAEDFLQVKNFANTELASGDSTQISSREPRALVDVATFEDVARNTCLCITQFVLDFLKEHDWSTITIIFSANDGKVLIKFNNSTRKISINKPLTLQTSI